MINYGVFEPFADGWQWADFTSNEAFDNYGTVNDGIYFESGCTVKNESGGTINAGVLIGGTVTNYGTINFNGIYSTTNQASCRLENYGVVNFSVGVGGAPRWNLRGGGVSSASGLILAPGGTLYIGGTAGANTFTITGGQFTGGGTVCVLSGAQMTFSATTQANVSFQNDGKIEVAGGTLTLAQGITGAGVITMDPGTTLALGAPQSFTNTIAGFAQGDTIDLLGVTGTSVSMGANDVLTVDDAGSTVATLQLAGDYSSVGAPGGVHFLLGSDGTGGTTITFGVPPAPTVSAGALATYVDSASPTPVTADGDLSIIGQGRNNGTLTSATVSIASGYLSGDILAATTVGTAITANYNPSSRVLSLTGSDSTVDYESVLQSVTFVSGADAQDNGSNAVRTLSWVVNDGQGASAASTSAVAIADAPPTLTVPTPVVEATQNDVVALQPQLGISDIDNTALSGAAVAVAAGFAVGEALSLDTTGTAITVASNANGVLSLLGRDTLANYAAVLRTVRYATAASSYGVRQITWSATDASGVTSSATSVLDLTPSIKIANGGGLVSQSQVTLSGTIDLPDAGSATVAIFDGSQPVGQGTVDSTTGAWSANVTLTQPGINRMSAQATDPFGGTATSASLNFNLAASVAYFEANRAAFEGIAGGFGIVDTAGNLSAAFDALSTENGLLSITISDSNAIALTASQVASDAAAIGKLSNANGQPVELVIGNSSAARVLLAGGDYGVATNVGGSWTGPLLSYLAKPVTPGAFGAWAPIAAAGLLGGGYEVAWKNGSTGQYTVWSTDANGNYLSSPFGAVAGTSFALESRESHFQQDLNGDGEIGLNPTQVTGISGPVKVLTVGGDYAVATNSGLSLTLGGVPVSPWTGSLLSLGGNPVTPGEFGAWVPIAAAALSGGGYEVAWKYGSTGQYTVWKTDANGNYLSSPFGAVAGTDPRFEQLETTFGQNLNGDGTVGLVGYATQTIQTDGGTSLVEIANNYFALDSAGGAGPLLGYQNAAVTFGEFGAWSPVGAAALSSGGYEVAWKYGSTGQYTVWKTDANGNYLSSPFGAVAGTDPRLEQLETTFGQDLNGDGEIGLNPTQVTGISGSVKVLTVGGDYAVATNSGLSLTLGGVPVSPWTGSLLSLGGNPVTPGEFGAWVPIAVAALSGGGYEVAWKYGSTGQYTVWKTDANGNYLSSPFGAVAGTDPRLEQLETTFGQDLNGDGTVGLIGYATQTIQTDGGTSLVEIANNYFALDSAGGAGPLLEYQNAAVTVGEFGAWSPVGAAALSGGGYEVAWMNGSTGQYTVWNTDANGNYLSSPFGAVAGTDPRLEQLETMFGQNLNGDGTVGLIGYATQTIQTDGGTSLVEIANTYFALDSAGGAGPLLKYQNAAVTVGEFGAWSPVGAAALSGGGYEVAWKNGSTGQYTVWNTDANGNYLNSPIGAVSGQSFALEDLEPSFGQDLNGDGWLSSALVSTAGSNGVVNLSGQTQPTTVDLGANGAVATGGLDAAALVFAGTPDDVTFGLGKSILEYAMTPSSGIEEVENFAYGTDLLNLDLLGGGSNSLVAFDATVGGNHAIALASSSDLQHGVVLLNMPAADTAANLLSSHVTFTGGHFFVS